MKKMEKYVIQYNRALFYLGIFTATAFLSDLIVLFSRDRVVVTDCNLLLIALAAALGIIVGKNLASRITSVFAFGLLGFLGVFISAGNLPVSYNLVIAFLVATGASLPVLHDRQSIKRSIFIGSIVALATFAVFCLFIGLIAVYNGIWR